MPVTFDVAVIGGGIAGVSAALAAQLRGARTCLIRAAPGATALTSGAWSGPLRAELREHLATSGLSMVPTHAPLPHERGHTVSAEFAAASHASATIETETTVCGFSGLPHFNAHTLARIWNPDSPMRAHTIDLAETPAGGWSTASLAAQIERAPEALVPHLQKSGIRRVIFPAVLGIEDVAAVISSLSAHGIAATEALAASPSIPGWRLQQALDRMLMAHGITTLNGRAVTPRSDARRVEQLQVGDEQVRARSFVLATGKYTACGIIAGEEFQESVFDLPIWLEQLGDVFTAPDALTLTDPVRTADQPLLDAGVHVDEKQRPVNRARDVVHENVFVAGTIRAGWQTAMRGLGDCAEDGWTAGENASE